MTAPNNPKLEFEQIVKLTTGDKWHILNDPDGNGFQIVATKGDETAGDVIAVVGGLTDNEAQMNALLIKATKNLLPTFLDHYDLMHATLKAALDLMASSEVYVNNESDAKYQALLKLLDQVGIKQEALLPPEVRDAVRD